MLDDLRALVEFAQAGSIARAADRLFRTPSAITRQVQRLEAALGAEVLDRSVKPSRLNSLGVRVLCSCPPKVDAALSREWRHDAGGRQQDCGDEESREPASDERAASCYRRSEGKDRRVAHRSLLRLTEDGFYAARLSATIGKCRRLPRQRTSRSSWIPG